MGRCPTPGVVGGGLPPLGFFLYDKEGRWRRGGPGTPPSETGSQTPSPHPYPSHASLNVGLCAFPSYLHVRNLSSTFGAVGGGGVEVGGVYNVVLLSSAVNTVCPVFFCLQPLPPPRRSGGVRRPPFFSGAAARQRGHFLKPLPISLVFFIPAFHAALCEQPIWFDHRHNHSPNHHYNPILTIFLIPILISSKP